MDLRYVFISLCTFCLLVLSCGDPDDDMTVGTETASPEAVRNILQMSCSFSSCHGMGRGAGGLSLLPDPITRIVGVNATGRPEKILVVPGSVADSYLMEKLTLEMPEVGDRMPPSVALETERLDVLRRWIEAGAPSQ